MSTDGDSTEAGVKATSELRPRLLTIAEAAVVLNVPENWLRKKVTARAVPFTLIGRHVRFTSAHLDSIIGAGEQRPLERVSNLGPSRRARRAS